ncbi:hypothetical protein Bpfe_023905 [Biomphalaria pfeifferi]|uniref:Uncharacterized protein n=1 Tax=Biomphalaria pfeifferi TaxID=112525 RepID=A0AAD8B3D0_BIOPF|nr:hypothetical protein Bpfe_023905 [Biomphalaria pfeifferi]
MLGRVQVIFGTMVILMMGTLAGFVSPYWFHDETMSEILNVPVTVSIAIGLFYQCAYVLGGGCDSLPWAVDPIFFLIVRILVITSTLCIFISIILNGFRLRNPRSVSITRASAIAGILAGVLGISAVAIYAANVDSMKGWSFYLSGCGSGVVLLVSIAALVMSEIAWKRSSSKGYDNQAYAMEWSSPVSNK